MQRRETNRTLKEVYFSVKYVVQFRDRSLFWTIWEGLSGEGKAMWPSSRALSFCFETPSNKVSCRVSAIWWVSSSWSARVEVMSFCNIRLCLSMLRPDIEIKTTNATAMRNRKYMSWYFAKVNGKFYSLTNFTRLASWGSFNNVSIFRLFGLARLFRLSS